MQALPNFLTFWQKTQTFQNGRFNTLILQQVSENVAQINNSGTQFNVRNMGCYLCQSVKMTMTIDNVHMHMHVARYNMHACHHAYARYNTLQVTCIAYARYNMHVTMHMHVHNYK